jgi:sigma-B regulation protein RsbQ
MVNVAVRNNVKVVGESDKVLVFAHGFGCDQNVWRHLIKALKPYFRCVTFDYVGAGASTIAAYDSKKYSSLDGYAQDVLDVCESLNLKAPIFVGHSVSCMVGVRAALLRPGYFSRLIFVTPSPSYINDGDYIGGMDHEDILGLLEMMDSNYLGWSSQIAPLVMGNADRPELGEELTANFCSTNPAIAKEFARVTFLTDSRGDLDKLTIPTLTIQCMDDMLVPHEIGLYIQQRLPNNTLTVINATGHCPHLSAAQETVEAILAYLVTIESKQLACA